MTAFDFSHAIILTVCIIRKTPTAPVRRVLERI